jgi:hypothetical protein
MSIDIFSKKAHTLNKKHTGNFIMLEIIDPIVRCVPIDLIKKYLDKKRICHRFVKWDLSYPLLRVEINKMLEERISPEKKSSVIKDFIRIERMSHQDGLEALSLSIFELPTLQLHSDCEKSFWCFLNYRKLFEDAEIELNLINPNKLLLQKIITNKSVLGGLFLFISFFINLAQMCSDETESRYVALNIFHFILGALTVFCMNMKKKRKL